MAAQPKPMHSDAERTVITLYRYDKRLYESGWPAGQTSSALHFGGV